MSGNERSTTPVSNDSALHSRLAALMFTDIVDSTGMKSRVSTTAYTTNLKRHNALFQNAIAASRDAKIIKHTGDGFFAQFQTASDAARCALKFQGDLASETWPGETICARIGIHMGEIAMVRMLDRTDIVGSPADVAARVMSLGSARQILLSKLAADEARRFVVTDDVCWTRHGHYKLKGVDDPLEIWEIAGVAGAALPPPSGAITKAPTIVLDLTTEHPEQIGPYRIVEPLGEGGMGTVFKAEQRSPVKRTVALKLIKLGLGSKEVIARFESERQALARMDHPHIAKVLDAGHDTLGRPFFVMEYVPGVPITRFADDNKLSIRHRLELFVQACEAIAHAHTKAIIHRDIKASNVLGYMADGKPAVKVIDFGIAKAMTGDRLTDLTINTSLGRAVGTYESMSPEQADGSPDIDTRTDVYSLGVLLYELLTGAQPFERDTLANAAVDEVRRIIREVEPPRPSARLTTVGEGAPRVASLRGEQLDTLCRQLRGELEWIPLKAMRKERDRRYVSAHELARDIENYLQQRPLLAGPESRAYRLRKFLKRNKRLVVGASIIAFVLLACCIGTFAGFARAGRMQREKVAKIETLVASSNEQAVLLTDAGKLKEAEALLRDARDESRNELGPDHPATLRAASDLALVLKKQGRLADAEALNREILERRRRSLGDNHPETIVSLNNLGAQLRAQGRLVQAEPLLRESLERSRAVHGPAAQPTLTAMHNLAMLLQAQGKISEAEVLHRDTLARRRLSRGDDDIETLISMNSLGVLLRDKGYHAEAEALLREVLNRRRSLLGDEHSDTLMSMYDLGSLFRDAGKLSEAEALFQEALRHRRRKLPPLHPDLLGTEYVYARVLDRLNRSAEAEPLYKALYLDAPQAEIAPGLAAIYMTGYGRCLVKLGRYAEAEQPLREAYDRLLANKLSSHRVVPEVLTALTELYAKTDRPTDAEQWKAKLAEFAPPARHPPATSAASKPLSSTQPG
ncbi:hypothetical protein BH09PLA1_BH09PLA1_24400 [soil metagenome]